MNQRNIPKSELKNIVKNNQEFKEIFDKSTLKHNNQYTYNVLYQELLDKDKRSITINGYTIYDSDQFVISILPQILSNSLDKQIKISKSESINENDSLNDNDSIDENGLINKMDSINCLDKILKEKFSWKKEGNEIVTNQNYKRNSIIITPRYIKGGEIVQEILDILSLIYEKDKKRCIQYNSKDFVDGIIYQLKFFFLSISLFSPCSQMMVKYPFLFGMNERLFLFQLLTKEPLMAKEFYLKKMDINYRPEKNEPFSKIMFIVHRENLFKEGITILKKFAKYKSFIEISFHNDVGYGTGTTSQFFDKMSLEFCKKRHRLWRRDNEEDEKESIYVKNKNGLFPYATANSNYMYALGLFVAKAIQMEQVIDIPFNPAFFDLAAGRTIKMEDVDKELAKSLYDETTEETMIEYEQNFAIIIEGKEFDLVKKGKEINVTHENYHIYVRAMEDYVFGKHVKKKIDKFVDGFAEVLDPIFLKMFSGEEMIKILNGSKELLTFEDMSKYIIIDTGYDNDSIQIQYLKEIVADFDYENQKKFIKYITGSSYLPYGGLEVLNPPIKVIRRVPHDAKYKADECWPAAKTCAHQFLLPPYQSKEQMRDNILTVISNPLYNEFFGLT